MSGSPPPEYRRVTIICEDIYQQTSDSLRTLLGLFWTKDNNTEYNTSDIEYEVSSRGTKYEINLETDLNLREVSRMDAASYYIDKIEFNPNFAEKVNEDSFFPNFKIPLRIYADKANSRGDKFWNTLFNGGTFGAEIFPSIVSSPYVFYDESLYIDMPYSAKEVRDNPEGLSGVPELQITCEYNSYSPAIQNYQSWTSNLESELLIPNANTLAAASNAITAGLNMEAVYSQLGADYLNYVVFSPLHLMKGSYVSIESGGTGIDFEGVYPWARTIFDPTYYSLPGSYAESVGDWLWSTGITAKDFQERKHGIVQTLMGWFNHWFITKASGYRKDSFHQFLGDQKDFIDSIPPSLKEKVIESQKNIIFDESAYDESLSNPTKTRDSVVAKFPYHMKIKFPKHSSGTDMSIESSEIDPMPGTTPFRDAIVNNHLSPKFLETLKDVHDGVFPDIKMIPRDFIVEESTYHPDTPSKLGQTTSKKTYNTVDFIDFLTKAYNNYDGALNANYQFMGTTPEDYLSVQQDYGIYRYLDNQNILGCLNNVSSLGEIWFDFMNFAAAESDEANKKLLKDIIQPKLRPSEVLAYRVEKTGGVTVGDQASSKVLQNFWLFNGSLSTDEFITLEDTQIKYGQEYTYSVSAYVLVFSHRYRYSDFRLTQQIGTVDTDGADGADKYCLQFYDPTTDEYESQLFYETATDSAFAHFGPEDTRSKMIEFAYDTGAVYGAGTDSDSGFYDFLDLGWLGASGILGTAEFTAISLRNQFATDQQAYSKHPQLADVNFNIEPCVKIIEVPMYTKTLKMMDNPANDIIVTPFQFIDDSHRLGFQSQYDTYREDSYPEPITSTDVNLRSHYLHAKDLTETSEITWRSQSPPRYLEVFRTDIRPKSMRDFENNLVRTIDLRISDSDQNYADAIIGERVLTNKKYYYVLRFLNENRFPGHLSQIITAELIDDGGYIYSTFGVLSEEEYIKDIYSKPSINFKKLFQIQPNISQLELDASGANMKLSATNEKNKVTVGPTGTDADPIWNQTFKIRMTSKKTGKKIDLNVLFQLETEDRFSTEET